MTEARAQASRKNGAKGRGPRTAAGRAKVVQNARKHGLNTSVLDDLAWSKRVIHVAEALAGGGELTDTLLDYARCHVEFERTETLKGAARRRLPLSSADPIDPAEVAEALAALRTYAGYERKIFSRFKKADLALAMARAGRAVDAASAER